MSSSSAADTERRSRLLGVALAAIVRDRVGPDAAIETPRPFPPGAALVHAHEAWVLLDDQPQRRLGSALAWTLRAGARSLHVVAREGTGVLARRAGELAMPIEVLTLDGRATTPAAAEPIRVADAPPADQLAFVDLIEEGGASPVVEHGVLAGEVRGLEVCRVVDDPHTGTVRLEVGVGAHDREAFALIYGDVPAVDALRNVVAAVSEARVPGSRHPLSRLAPERLVRWRLLEDPSLVGATALFPADPPLPRSNLKDVVACTATGTDDDANAVVVVCSSGVDLDVVPYAVDARLAAKGAPGVAGGGPRTIVVMPTRDLVPLQAELAALAREPLELLTID